MTPPERPSRNNREPREEENAFKRSEKPRANEETKRDGFTRGPRREAPADTGFARGDFKKKDVTENEGKNQPRRPRQGAFGSNGATEGNEGGNAGNGGDNGGSTSGFGGFRSTNAAANRGASRGGSRGGRGRKFI